jgi:hypothetical protein
MFGVIRNQPTRRRKYFVWHKFQYEGFCGNAGYAAEAEKILSPDYKV